MSTIKAQSVKSLRDRTGAGMMDCKKALLEVGGDEEQAIDLLRKWGAAKAAKRAERATSEGAIHIDERDGTYAMVAVTSETDFVARNDEFKDFTQRVGDAILGAELPDGEVLTGEQLLERPEFSAFETELTDLRARIGENITIHQAVRLAPAADSTTATYLHFGGKIGVIVELAGGAGHDDAARDVAMHVAAFSPRFLDNTSVDSTTLDAEREIYAAQARNEGKKEELIPKIVDGKIRAFYKDNCLVDQAFAKDPSKSVTQYVADLSKETGVQIKLTGFRRVNVGQTADAKN
jgi:elongation factor Ts